MLTASRRVLLVVAALSLIAGGCKSKEKDTGGSSTPAPTGTGKALASGLTTDLRVSPDGTVAAYLLDAKRPMVEGTAPQVQLGELRFARVDGSLERKAGDRVINTPGGYLFSPDSRWLLFLQGYNPADHFGQLVVQDTRAPSGGARALGQDVSYFVISPDSKWVAYVESGMLKVTSLDTEAAPVDVAGEVKTAEFAPDSRALLVKRSVAAAAGLLLVPVGDWSKQVKLGEDVGDYTVASDGAAVAFTMRNPDSPSSFDLFHAALPSGKVKKVATAVTTGASHAGPTFAFSPDGKWLGRIESGRSDKRGTLVVGPSSGAAGAKVAEQVYRFEFSADSAAVAYLDKYADNSGPGAGHGNVGIATGPEWAPKKLGTRVPNFNWGADGKHLAFISRFFQPVYSVDLMLYAVGEEAPKKIQAGVFGYEFSSQNKYLLLRTACVREGRACELHALELGKPDAKPQKLLDGVYSFRTASQNPQRVLATYARLDTPHYDAMAFNLGNQQYKTLDRNIQLPALFASPDGAKVIYVVAEKGRAGVYVSDAMP